MFNHLKRKQQPPNPDFHIMIDGKDNITDAPKSTFNPKKLHHKIKNKHPLTKKEKWIVGAESGISIVGVVLLVLIFTHSTKLQSPPVPKPDRAVVVPPPKILSRLTGLPVTAAEQALPVTGVMIENTPDARPQSGLSDAGVVFEAIAEAGITRFLALFEENQSTSLGPIRSARPYYIDWALGFNATYVHVGGSPDALSKIGTIGIRDLNEFSYGSYFHRISTRVAPHNVYTSMSELSTLEQSKSFTTSTFTGFPRKDDKPLAKPTATKIDMNISSSSYNVHYDYDPTTNAYNRSEGGAAMTDSNTGKQIQPKVVVAMIMPWTNGALDASGAYYTQYSDIGSSTAYIFQDGGVIQGTWSKPYPTSQVLFTDATGAAIKFNAGQTWLTAVGLNSQLVYTP